MLEVKAQGTGAPREPTELMEGTEGLDWAGGRQEPEKTRCPQPGKACTSSLRATETSRGFSADWTTQSVLRKCGKWMCR